MIFYRPTDGDPHTGPLELRPRTCFLMTQLGSPIPEALGQIRDSIGRLLAELDFHLIDADSVVTGKDFLIKIWSLLLSVPLGIAIVHEDMRPTALSNIFYELGVLHSNGKETLIVKTERAEIPSDFVRTEYIKYDDHFEKRLGRFLESTIDQAAYYERVAGLLERDPLLSIDYLRRSYLISGEERIREQVGKVVASAGWENRAQNSVESLFANF